VHETGGVTTPRPDPSAEACQTWLRGLGGDWRDVRVSTIDPLDGYSSINRRLGLVDGPVDRLVLKVQPASGIFEPYDVLREAAVLRGLAGTDVPVPEVLGEERDPAALGAPFFVMSWIDAPHMGEADDGGASYPAFFATVARVHDVDWRAAGLDLLGVPASAAAGFQAEVDLVAQRMEQRGVHDELLLAARDRLRTVQPTDGRLALCQGDVNVFNYLVRDGEVVGVVDWEQARISDPRSDLGQLLALLLLKEVVPFGPADDDVSLGLYEAAGAGPQQGLEPFRALWLYQLGFIHRAFVAGTGDDPWWSWAQIEQLLPSSLELL
jgi:aminoglycoside phosphotransferase (APT) family kinase protein